MKQQTETRDLHTYTTEDGFVVNLCAVSHVLLSEIPEVVRREYKEAGMPITPPTYEVTLVGGETQTETHDETTLQYPLELALDRAENDPKRAREIVAQETTKATKAWAAYQQTLAEIAVEVQNRQTKYMLRRGIKDWDGGREVPPEWVEECRMDGFTPPEDQQDLDLYWILRGLLKTPQDQVNVIFSITALTSKGVDNDHVTGALEFFRNKMEGHDTPPGAGPADNSAVLDDEPKGSSG